MPKTNEELFLELLKRTKPYLYSIEMEIARVSKETGFGDVSISLVIRDKKVHSIDVASWVKQLYDKKVD